jgi:hypothetical protein
MALTLSRPTQAREQLGHAASRLPKSSASDLAAAPAASSQASAGAEPATAQSTPGREERAIAGRSSFPAVRILNLRRGSSSTFPQGVKDSRPGRRFDCGQAPPRVQSRPAGREVSLPRPRRPGVFFRRRKPCRISGRAHCRRRRPHARSPSYGRRTGSGAARAPGSNRPPG